jgi:glyoxylase-like metal-dependent hydrolase (beta-lactamase superfamily II)
MNPAGIIIKQLEIGPMMNFIYIVGCEETREAAAVDPAWDVPEILSEARQLGLDLCHILVTHAHPDHVNGLEEMIEATDAPVYIHREEIGFIRDMAVRYQIAIDFLEKRSGNVRTVGDDDLIQVGNIPIRAIHTPGHTPGSQCFLAGKNLLAGDTLFIDACGRVDLPGSDPERMWSSLNRTLRNLDDDIRLYPGHSYGGKTSTLGRQKITNPYLQFDSMDQFLRAMGMG